MRKGFSDNQNFKTIEKAKPSKKTVIMFFVLLILMLFVFYEVFSLVEYTLGKKTNQHMYLYNFVAKIVNKVPESLSTQTTEDYSLKYAALGDIYETTTNISIAKSSDTYDFTTGTEEAVNVLKNYDLVTASLNTPISTGTYSTSTKYNSPKEILDTIKALNIKALATANYHSYDKVQKGISETIQNIKEAGIDQVGLNDQEGSYKPTVFEKNNIKIGILSYYTSSNVDIADKNSYLIRKMSQENIDEDVKYLKSQNVDFIVSYLSVPNSTNILNSEQKNDAEQLFNSGINIVFCTGSNIVFGKTQDIIETKDKEKIQIYASYSLGDFIGKTDTIEHTTSIISDITFTKKVVKDKDGKIIDSKTQKSFNINKPIIMWTDINKSSSKIYKIDDAITKYESGELTLTKTQYQSLKEEKTRIEELYK